MFLPLIMNYISSYLFEMDFSKYKKPPFQPPNYIFPIIWIINYICLGYVFHINRKNKISNIFMIMILFLLNYWLYIQSSDDDNLEKLFYILLSVTIISIIYVFYLSSINSSYIFLLIYIIWLILATSINSWLYGKYSTE